MRKCVRCKNRCNSDLIVRGMDTKPKWDDFASCDNKRMDGSADTLAILKD